MKGTGKRFNEGKLRYDLVHPFAHEQMVRVLTKGANKYGDNNWSKGMAWSKCLASLERHLAEMKKGNDYDPESGELHASHIACNAHFLSAYYKIYPQGDDRPKDYLNRPKIGLDIDEVIADWITHWCNKFGHVEPEFWNFDPNIKEKFDKVKNNKDFWLSIPPKFNPSDLQFEPYCYITARSIPKEWTQEWIATTGFPTVPIYTVGFEESKVDVAKESGIDIFVEDRYENMVELNNAGICTFLLDAKHNQRYDVGFKRIYHVNDVI